MATKNAATIGISDDAFLVFIATRIVDCNSFDCVNNNDDCECVLKKVYIGKGGKCAFYQQREDKQP